MLPALGYDKENEQILITIIEKVLFRPYFVLENYMLFLSIFSLSKNQKHA